MRGSRLGGLLVLGAALALGAPAAQAQMESREGIALQNQILQLRNELEQLRRAGGAGGGGFLAPPARPGAPQGELVGPLLDRTSLLEEEVRRLRGRVDVLENQNRRLREDLEKFQGDMEFRLGQGASAAAPAPAPAPAAPAARPPRTPERALQDGQAALARNDFAAAEAAAREVIASRAPAGSQVAAFILLGDALMGRRDHGNAAIAYDDAYTRARTGPRAPEALIGLANALAALNNRREACDTLNGLRSQFPNLSGPMAQRAAQARQRAQCR